MTEQTEDDLIESFLNAPTGNQGDGSKVQAPKGKSDDVYKNFFYDPLRPKQGNTGKAGKAGKKGDLQKSTLKPIGNETPKTGKKSLPSLVVFDLDGTTRRFLCFCIFALGTHAFTITILSRSIQPVCSFLWHADCIWTAEMRTLIWMPQRTDTIRGNLRGERVGKEVCIFYSFTVSD